MDSSSKENKIYDNQLPSWISKELSKTGITINDDALLILTENIGNNLEKIDNALDKVSSNKSVNFFVSPSLVLKGFPFKSFKVPNST